MFRSIRFSIQNIRRNLWLTFVTVFILVLTTISITLVGGINVVTNQLVHAIESKVDIDVYFYTTADEALVLEAQDYFKGMDEVSEVLYTSQDEALEIFVESHADDPETLQALAQLDKNPLPASLTIRTKDITDYPKILNRVEESEYQQYIDRANYSDSADIITNINKITSRAYQIGIVVSAIFTLISIIVIFNTIRIAIYSHRDEIAIMKLVGAQNSFIRSPFFIEGIIIAVLSASITIGLSVVMIYISDPALSAFFTGYDFSLLRYFNAHSLQFVLIELGGAIILSTVSSMVAVSRYLRV